MQYKYIKRKLSYQCENLEINKYVFFFSISQHVILLITRLIFHSFLIIFSVKGPVNRLTSHA
jgi:hypothetical protein